MTLEEALTAIIDTIPNNCTVDSHFIINQLISNYSIEYLDYIRTFTNGSDFKVIHGKLAQVIDHLGILIKIPKQSYSKNIKGNISQCQLWEKS